VLCHQGLVEALVLRRDVALTGMDADAVEAQVRQEMASRIQGQASDAFCVSLKMKLEVGT
jgi:predicted kinase